METIPRHQCLIYDGPPSRGLPALAAMMREKLRQNYRCVYLNSPAMVAGMRSRLWMEGIDVAAQTARGSVLLTSDRIHLVEGRFDAGQMMQLIETSLNEALRDGFTGLWATGDMTWEMGQETDFQKLVEYEWRLEKFFQTHPALSGVCQYHAQTLPREMLRHSLVVHPGIFVNETLQLLNPDYASAERLTAAIAQHAELDAAIDRHCRSGA
ncbi:MAG TPA: MEDS domain-containing protein [Acidobacteriaceae bacterium]|nr:MEDS domain-containing protein [Acidobacteriaceae bacterium]